MTVLQYEQMMSKNKARVEHWADILDNEHLIELLIGEARREQREMSRDNSDGWDDAIDMVNRLKEAVLARMK